MIWLGNFLWAIVFGAARGSMYNYYREGGFNAVPLVLVILTGGIPPVIALIAMRLGLEFAIATVRTAQNTSRIAETAQQR